MANKPTPAWAAVKKSFIDHNNKLMMDNPNRERCPEWVLVLIGSARCSYWCAEDPGDEVMPGWAYLETKALRMTKVEAVSIMCLDQNAWAWRYTMVVQFDPEKPGMYLPTANGWPLIN